MREMRMVLRMAGPVSNAHTMCVYSNFNMLRLADWREESPLGSDDPPSGEVLAAEDGEAGVGYPGRAVGRHGNGGGGARHLLPGVAHAAEDAGVAVAEAEHPLGAVGAHPHVVGLAAVVADPLIAVAAEDLADGAHHQRRAVRLDGDARGPAFHDRPGGAVPARDPIGRIDLPGAAVGAHADVLGAVVAADLGP